MPTKARPPKTRTVRKTRRLHASRVLKWGNSAAVLLPKFVAEAANLTVGTEITYAMQNGGVLLRPANKLPTVADLLEGVTPEKVERLQWGKSVGKEVVR